MCYGVARQESAAGSSPDAVTSTAGCAVFLALTQSFGQRYPHRQTAIRFQAAARHHRKSTQQRPLAGGEANDWYYFGDGWGKDSVTYDQASANELHFRNGPSSNAFVTEELVITLNAGEGPEVTDTSGTNTINWEGNVIYQVIGAEGDDQITGNALSNLLTGGPAGTDTIFGRAGNGEIDVLDGSPDDTVDCGENFVGDTDSDFVLYHPGDDIDLTNCEDTSTQP